MCHYTTWCRPSSSLFWRISTFYIACWNRSNQIKTERRLVQGDKSYWEVLGGLSFRLLNFLPITPPELRTSDWCIHWLITRESKHGQYFRIMFSSILGLAVGKLFWPRIGALRLAITGGRSCIAWLSVWSIGHYDTFWRHLALDNIIREMMMCGWTKPCKLCSLFMRVHFLLMPVA